MQWVDGRAILSMQPAEFGFLYNAATSGGDHRRECDDSLCDSCNVLAGLHFSTPVFTKACELAKIKPTKRQASRWRSGKGLARMFMVTAISVLANEQRAKEDRQRKVETGWKIKS